MCIIFAPSKWLTYSQSSLSLPPLLNAPKTDEYNTFRQFSLFGPYTSPYWTVWNIRSFAFFVKRNVIKITNLHLCASIEYSMRNSLAFTLNMNNNNSSWVYHKHFKSRKLLPQLLLGKHVHIVLSHNYIIYGVVNVQIFH